LTLATIKNGEKLKRRPSLVAVFVASNTGMKKNIHFFGEMFGNNMNIVVHL